MRKRSIASIVLTCSTILVAGEYLGLQTAIPSTGVTSSPLGVTTSTPKVSPSATPSNAPTSIPTSTPTISASPSVRPTQPATATTTSTGDIVNTQYGTVQVELTFKGTTITDVKALKLTDQGGRSVQISNYAAPILRNEVLKSQSANVASVSGATYTTDGYLTSVQSAIDKHKA